VFSSSERAGESLSYLKLLAQKPSDEPISGGYVFGSLLNWKSFLDLGVYLLDEAATKGGRGTAWTVK